MRRRWDSIAKASAIYQNVKTKQCFFPYLCAALAYLYSAFIYSCDDGQVLEFQSDKISLFLKVPVRIEAIIKTAP